MAVVCVRTAADRRGEKGASFRFSSSFTAAQAGDFSDLTSIISESDISNFTLQLLKMSDDMEGAITTIGAVRASRLPRLSTALCVQIMGLSTIPMPNRRRRTSTSRTSTTTQKVRLSLPLSHTSGVLVSHNRRLDVGVVC